MSLSELLTYELPDRSGFSRRAKHPMRRLRRTLRNYFRRQYYITHALADVQTAVGRNEDIVIGSLLIAFMTAFGFSVLSAQLMFTLFNSTIAVSDSTHMSFILLFFIALGSVLALSAWLTAFFTNSLSVAVMEGATGKQLRSLRRTLRKSLKNATRVSVAWLLVAAVVALPLLAAAVLAVVAAKLAGGLSVSPDSLLAIGGSIVVAWTLYALSTYSLAGQAALFETDQPITKTLKRSRQLVSRRGRIFMLAVYALSAGLGVGFDLINTFGNRIGINGDGILYIGIFVSILFASSLKTALYRRRKLARTR